MLSVVSMSGLIQQILPYASRTQAPIFPYSGLPGEGGGRQVALEFLFNDTNIISNAILAGNSMGIKVGMQQAASASFIFEKYLHGLCKQEIISNETAREFATEQSVLDQMILGSYAIPSPDALLEHQHRH